MASSGVEALLGCPQFKLNYERQHTKGLAMILIFMWLLGDFYKLSYYNSTGAPVQLLACAAFQVVTDIAILSQFWLYRVKTAQMTSQDQKKSKFELISLIKLM